MQTPATQISTDKWASGRKSVSISRSTAEMLKKFVKERGIVQECFVDEAVLKFISEYQ